MTIPLSTDFIHGHAFLETHIDQLLANTWSEHFSVDNFCLFDRSQQRMIRYFGEEFVIEIPQTVEVIEEHCFAGLETVETVKFPDDASTKVLGSFAFARTYISKIAIPKSVEIIKESCFQDCEALSHVIFEPGSSLKRIESKAFNGTALKSIELPDGDIEIGADAFPFSVP